MEHRPAVDENGSPARSSCWLSRWSSWPFGTPSPAALAGQGEYSWDFDPGWLGLAGVLYLLGLLPAGLFWHRVLLVLGQDARLGETLRAYYIGHLGKYVPGKAMVVVIRAGLIRSHRVHDGRGRRQRVLRDADDDGRRGVLRRRLLAVRSGERARCCFAVPPWA